MEENQQLADRITALQDARGFSERGLCLAAGLKVDRVKSAIRSKTVPLWVLRDLARVLECRVGYLIEVAPGLRLDSEIDAQQIEWLLRYEDLSPASRDALLAAARSLVPTAAEIDTSEPAAPRKRGRL